MSLESQFVEGIGLVERLRDEVHLWHLNLDVTSLYLERFAELLSEEEVMRIQAYASPLAASQFCVCRAVLRILLEQYGQGPAAEILFRKNEFGKPSAVTSSSNQVEFNLSHSGSCGIVAFANCPIGIDIEEHRKLDVLGMAKLAFSNDDCLTFADAGEDEGSILFLRGWTRKEAAIKAIGKGMAIPMSSFDVSLGDNPGEVWEQSCEGHQLTMHDVSDDHFSAAVAYIGSKRPILANKLEPYDILSKSLNHTDVA